MQKDDCFLLGTLTTTHGLEGEMHLKVDADESEKYLSLEMVFVEVDGKLIPFYFNKIAPYKGDIFLIQFDDVDNLESSQRLTGKNVFLPLDLLPKKEGKHFYFHEVIGFSVHDNKQGNIGVIKQVLEYPSQPVFEVDHSGKEVLVPITDDFIENIDREKKIITMNLPEGLLEVYLG